MIALLFTLFAQVAGTAQLDNAYVRVTRNQAPCAAASAGCGRRIIVALGPVKLTGGRAPRSLSRGDVAVFEAHDSYAIEGRSFLEVVVKNGHPRATLPAGYVPPQKNALLYDSDDFFIFEEHLEPKDTRPRHGHGQRLVVVVNETRLQQWQDDGQEVFKNQVPDDVHFNEPVAHKVTNVGANPLRNIVIEFKP
jgi:hypothetical protein